MSDKTRMPLAFKHTYKSVSFKKVFQVVTQISLCAPDAALEEQTDKRLIISRTQELSSYIRKLLKYQHDSVPYKEIIDIDIDKKQFMIQARVNIRKYHLQVGIRYKQVDDDVHVSGKILIEGVQDPLLRKIAMEVIKQQYKICRNTEQQELRRRFIL